MNDTFDARKRYVKGALTGVFLLLLGILLIYGATGWFTATLTMSSVAGAGCLLIAPAVLGGFAMSIAGIVMLIRSLLKKRALSQDLSADERKEIRSLITKRLLRDCCILLLLFVAIIWFLRGAQRAAVEYESYKCKNRMKNIKIALEMYSSDSQNLYPARLSQIAPNYLNEIPFCSPSEYSSDEKHEYLYESSDDHAHFTLSCSVAGHPRSTEKDDPR